MRVGGGIKELNSYLLQWKSAGYTSRNSSMSILFKDMKVNITTKMYALWEGGRRLVFFIASLSILFELNSECINSFKISDTES